MYLIGLSNIDYIFLTVFFSLYTLNAYFKRDVNNSYDDYVGISTRYDYFPNFSFGFLEIIFVTYYTALYGLSVGAVFLILIVLTFISQLILDKMYIKYDVVSFFDLVNKLGLTWLSRILVIFNLLIILALISLLMNLLYTSVHSLMGWNFNYSVYALFGICLIAIIVGGRSALVFNKLLLYVVIGIAFLVLFICFLQKGDISITSKLRQLGSDLHLGSDYYTSLFQLNKFHSSLWLFTGVLYFLRILNYKKSSALVSKSRFIELSIKVIVLVILMLPALIALTTISKSGIIDGRKIVTEQTQFADGQMGYVIKAVDANSANSIATLGIVPSFSDNTNSLLARDGKYNYSIANLVAFQYYIPSFMMVLCLLMMLAGFLINIGDYLFTISQLTVENILIPTRLFAKYGEVGKLWMIRITLCSFSLLTLVLAKLTVSYFIY